MCLPNRDGQFHGSSPRACAARAERWGRGRCANIFGVAGAIRPHGEPPDLVGPGGQAPAVRGARDNAEPAVNRAAITISSDAGDDHAGDRHEAPHETTVFPNRDLQFADPPLEEAGFESSVPVIRPSF
jgi:hypothetical protein